MKYFESSSFWIAFEFAGQMDEDRWCGGSFNLALSVHLFEVPEAGTGPV